MVVRRAAAEGITMVELYATLPVRNENKKDAMTNEILAEDFPIFVGALFGMVIVTHQKMFGGRALD